MWGKIIIPMYRLWLNGLCGLYGPRCPLSSKRPITLISLSHSLDPCRNRSLVGSPWATLIASAFRELDWLPAEVGISGSVGKYMNMKTNSYEGGLWLFLAEKYLVGWHQACNHFCFCCHSIFFFLLISFFAPLYYILYLNRYWISCS